MSKEIFPKWNEFFKPSEKQIENYLNKLGLSDEEFNQSYRRENLIQYA